MKVTLGHSVYSSDGVEAGIIKEVIVHPRTLTLTHLVLQRGLLFHDDQLIDIHYVAHTNRDGIFLSMNHREVEEHAHRYHSEEFAEVKPIEFSGELIPQRIWRRPLAENYTIVPPGISGVSLPEDVAIDSDTIPLLHGAQVWSGDEQIAGHIEVILTDRKQKITHLVIGRGYIFSVSKLLPVEWIVEFRDNAIQLSLSSDELRNLEDF